MIEIFAQTGMTTLRRSIAWRRLVRGRGFRLLLAVFVACVVLPSSASSAQPAIEEAPQEVDWVGQQLDEVDRLRSEYHHLQDQESKLDGEERTLVVLQMRETVFELMRTINEVVAIVVRWKEEGAKRPLGLKRARRLLLEMDRTIPAYIDGLEAEAGKIRTALLDASDEYLEDLSIQIRGIEEILDEAYPFFLEHIEHREGLGLESGNVRKQLERRASERAAMLAGRVQLLGERRREARKAAESLPQDAALLAAIREADEELDTAASSLWSVSDVMDALEMDTSAYRQALIQTTGEITTDVLDVDVVLGLLDAAIEAGNRWLDRRAPLVLGRAARFVAIFVLFWMLGRAIGRIARRLTSRSENVSELSRGIVVSTASRTVIGLGLIVALSQVGVNVTALLTGLGIAGFIVGFALQDALGNFASGAMILLYRPFDVGDVIEAGGVYGRVDGMSLVSTTILTFDNQTMVVPNSRIWGGVIRNVTAQDIRRVDLEFGFSHQVDVTRAEEILASILRDHPQVLQDPEPIVKVHKLTDITTRIVVRPWVERENYWDVYWDVTREAKIRLEHESIPLGVPAQAISVSS